MMNNPSSEAPKQQRERYNNTTSMGGAGDPPRPPLLATPTSAATSNMPRPQQIQLNPTTIANCISNIIGAFSSPPDGNKKGD